MKKNISFNIGFGFVEALAVAFIVLKLMGVIHWRWLWVLAPVWIQLILAAIGFVAFVVIAGKLYHDDWMD